MSDWHTCHFCGEDVKDGKDLEGNRHWLSDCRPDLVQHEIGPICTWVHKRADEDCDDCTDYEPCEYHKTKPVQQDCYAYSYNNYAYLVNGGPPVVWTDKHEHFYPDGPM